MQVKQLWLLALALVAGSLLGIHLHPVAGVAFVSALLAYVLFFSSREQDEPTFLTADPVSADLSPTIDVPTTCHPLGETSAIVKEVVLESTANLAAQIGIQSDAVNTLKQALAQINSLLEQQRQSMQQPLYETGLDKSSASILARINNDRDELVGQLVNALHNAMRALQFEDMSTQNIRHTIQRLEELVPIATSLNEARHDFSQLKDELVKYRESAFRQKHNPVSATSVSSGSVDLF